MINTNDFQIKLTAALGALLVSFAFIGASVGPVRADTTTVSSQPAAVQGQVVSA